MINFRTGEKLYLVDLKITDDDPIERTNWNLSELASITTLDAIEDDERRKAIIAESQKGNHMIEGAVMGGVADSFIGDGGILTGVIVGALFGSQVPKHVQPDQALARIALLFRDGSTLPLEVDKNEYTELQSIAIDVINNRKPSEQVGKTKKLLEKQRIQNSPAYSNILLVFLSVIFIATLYTTWQGPVNFYAEAFGYNLLELTNQPVSVDLFPSATELVEKSFSNLLIALFYLIAPIILAGLIFMYILFFENGNQTYRYADEFMEVSEFGKLDDILYKPTKR